MLLDTLMVKGLQNEWLSNFIDSIVFTMRCICVIVCECVIVPLFVLVKNVDCHKREGRSRE